MGWNERTRQAQANQMAKHALRAIEEGRMIFAPKLASRSPGINVSEPITAWAEMIEAVESSGWVLTQWSVTEDGKENLAAYPVFRRS